MLTCTEREVAARRVRDSAYHPRRLFSRVPAITEVIPMTLRTDNAKPIVWALPLDRNGTPEFPEWFTEHERAMYPRGGTTWDANLEMHERLHRITDNAQCRALLAKCETIARKLDEATIADARLTVALDALNRRGPLT